MRTQAAGSFHENYGFMGHFHKFMTIQPIFDATGFFPLLHRKDVGDPE
jgi:hypothetical protein